MGEAMAVLAMDTATQVLAAAVRADGGREASVALQIPRGHSRLLHPALKGLLQASGVAPGDLREIIVGVGPGSYTGVRIGVAAAKAMAAALGIPVRPVSTLWMMAEAAAPGGRRPQPGSEAEATLVLPLLYARRQRAYGALYGKRGGVWRVVESEQVLPVAEWLARLRARLASAPAGAVKGAWTGVIVHDLAGPVEELLADGGGASRVWTLSDAAGRLGPSLLRLGERPEVPRLDGDALHALTPEYRLPVEAEVKLAERSLMTHGDG
ncbi:tRNA (adenosine(37)-N6)-threonylcarbamoyltransferase complex dimerization subunit type 1 TsaB [Alicyclobacillus sp.]|uniref:tRNA (adenosine(37)-N6)-threonylcarbamoyltransferase complex dimerization subunit type 1 TsaB n=1 Tax=Alicyclobacillus sp. TaxID=61169 RepID=UPI0025B949A5|nr:tRNA (adenosine(37)-N6)-threonylcarbamoyltransferase complex dimerization subunit type 1 TsaB [Alicyclobacillus sp.]MCL6517493.1 tRNA (adenosine(37)-N6)-threonylcarbamoyltransferase complex dimerization subunit type 1 TsaB [Alicyclobacillus sp.]